MKLAEMMCWSAIIGERRKLKRSIINSKDRKEIEADMRRAAAYRELENRLDQEISRVVKDCYVYFTFTPTEKVLLFDK